MPKVSLLNTEWRKVLSSLDLTFKSIDLKEKRILNEVSSLLAPYNYDSKKFYLHQISKIVYWAQESYSCSVKNKTATDSELHKLYDIIKKLKELDKEAQSLLSEYYELKAIYKVIEEASNKKNGFLERPAGSSSESSSTSSGNSIDDTILTDPWGY